MGVPVKGRADFWQAGEWNVACAECQRKRKSSEMRQLPAGVPGGGMWVCYPDHWNPRQPQDFVRGVPDKMAAPYVQEQMNILLTATYSVDYLDGTDQTLTITVVAGQPVLITVEAGVSVIIIIEGDAGEVTIANSGSIVSVTNTSGSTVTINNFAGGSVLQVADPDLSTLSADPLMIETI